MFKERLELAVTRIAAHFEHVFADLPESQIRQAMAYTCNGGKRLRGFLVLESARLHGVSAEIALWPATAIEALHAYSLVHDDLPAMDDDALRRGQPTVHVKWDDATAILTGDALQALGFELLTKTPEVSAAVQVRLVQGLALASGASGMVLGQALDIEAETASEPLTLEQITHLQAGKTGALIEWSACAGAVLAEADTAPLLTYAKALGLAFQIADDILDIEGDADKAGKRLQKDAEAGKATFVSLLGLEGARSRARELTDQACDALSPYGAEAETLRETARFVIARDS